MRAINWKILIVAFALFAIFYISFYLVKNSIDKRMAAKLRAEEIWAVQQSIDKFLDESYQYNWGPNMVQTFEDTLGIRPLAQSDTEPCHFNKHIVSTLTYPEQTLESHIWIYLSLYSLSSIDYLKPALTEKINNLLSKLFDKIHVPVINSIPRKCFELNYSIILGVFDNIVNVEPMTVPFLLEENAMKFKEVLKLQNEDMKKKFRFTNELSEKVYKELIKFNKTQQKLNYVGIYFDGSNDVEVI